MFAFEKKIRFLVEVDITDLTLMSSLILSYHKYFNDSLTPFLQFSRQDQLSLFTLIYEALSVKFKVWAVSTKTDALETSLVSNVL